MKRKFYLTVTTYQKEGYSYIAYYVDEDRQYVVDRDYVPNDYDEDAKYWSNVDAVTPLC